MSASLVGSEMCIRDSPYSVRHVRVDSFALPANHHRNIHHRLIARAESVSYTHLTLPTICSV
eukprot:7389853-Alexandrium_andersonii.AAC.1